MKKLFTITVFFVFSIHLSAQLIVETPLPPSDAYADWLVRNVLIGEGIDVSNVKFTGKFSATTGTSIAKFTTGSLKSTNLGIKEGIIMSTGNVLDAVGPNNSMGKSTDWVKSGDDDLNDLVKPYTTVDAAVLEFDFVPLSEKFEFKYIFGSEEYPEYVGTDYNDVFGFFITGPNPAGGNYNKKNIALIPGTNISITMNNVNNYSYSQYYVDNTNGATIQFDGFTKLFTASANVIKGSTYHVKIAIADVGDGSYDSGIFIEANSFNIPDTITRIINNDITICKGDSVVLTAKGAESYSWSNDGKSPSTIVFPMQTTKYYVTGTNNTIITIDSVTIFVNDVKPYSEFIFDNNHICAGDNYINFKAIDQNPEGTTYSWNFGDGITALGDSISHKYNYTNNNTIVKKMPVSLISTFNACFDTFIDTIYIYNLPIVNLGNDKTILKDSSVVLISTVGDSYLWSNNATTSSIMVSPTETTTYTVTVSYGICSASDAVIVYIEKDTLNIDTYLCFNKDVFAYELVQKLVGNVCVVFDNAKYTGAHGAKAIFSGTTPMGINDGIIFSTGDVTGAAVQSNQAYSVSNNTSGDPDLDILANPKQTYDAATLEFNFVPLSDSIFFNYVFGSEEYYSGFDGYSNYDLFALFVSGPGLIGKQNIATIPSTSTYISKETINRTTNNQYFNDNDNRNQNAYRGWTSIFRSGIKVQIGQTYYVKIVIADVMDYNIDSGVLLAAMDCSEPPPKFMTSAYSSNTSTNYQNIFYKGCENIIIKAKADKALSKETNVSISLSGSAIEGVDYTIDTIPINIPIGSDSAIFIITLFNDNINNSYKTININFYSSDFYIPSINNLIISDANPIQINLNQEYTIIKGDSITLTTKGDFYLWSNNATTNSIMVSPTETTTYAVTVSYGTCYAVDTVIVFVNEDVSVKEIILNNAIIKIYPNPVNDGIINIVVENIDYPFNITIVDAIGKTIQTKHIKETLNTVSFNLQDVENGIYFIKIQNNNFSNTYKAIVRR
ncbi:MAG: hypothetical protein A2X12_04960 [Bacteroidetes bacterium GWE2_29_8]|nr:MAG: hypothetical protein A2X12_04960 [Bacteroidetes bacterium GWE2_29_8]